MIYALKFNIKYYLNHDHTEWFEPKTTDKYISSIYIFRQYIRS